MGVPNLNDREYNAEVLEVAVREMCSGSGLPAFKRVDPAAPGTDETMAVVFATSHHGYTRDRIRDAWLVGHAHYQVDMSSVDEHWLSSMIMDGRVPKLLAEALSVRTMHPAFGVLCDYNAGLAEDGTQDECKESIENVLDQAVDYHLQIIVQGLLGYQIKVVSHEIQYTPPRLTIKARTARDRMQVNGIMTGGIVRRLMNGWVTANVYNKDGFSKTYEYHGMAMRHQNAQHSEENKGAHFEKGDEKLTRFEMTEAQLRFQEDQQKRYKMFGVVSGRVQTGVPFSPLKIVPNA